MSKKKKQHVHKYWRTVLGKDYVIYKCVLPGCTHYMPIAIAVGCLSLCWMDCGDAVQLDQDMINNSKTVKPVCDKCRREREERRQRLIAVGKEEEISR